MDVPEEIIDRMKSVPAKEQRQEGIKIAVETIEALKEMEGVHGVHIMAIEWEEAVPQLVEEAELSPRPDRLAEDVRSNDMPPKYHIQTGQVPNRFPAITKSGVIAWEEGCLKCARCVKKDCVYKVYEKRDLDARQMLDSLDSICKDCFRCVQNCPNKLIQKGLNPTYKALGDHYWTPEIMSGLWFQAEAAVSLFPAQDTADLSPVPALMPCGRTCPRSSGLHGTGSTAVNISAPPLILAGK